jgi:hypothetical protein
MRWMRTTVSGTLMCIVAGPFTERTFVGGFFGNRRNVPFYHQIGAGAGKPVSGR